MQNRLIWSLKCILITCITICIQTQFVWKAPDFFCSYICVLSYKSMADNGAFTCPTPYPIPQVDKFGHALTQLTKSASVQSKYMSSVTPTAFFNTTSFTLTLNIQSFDNIYFTFTIVAIGNVLANTWIDLFNHYHGDDIFNTLQPWQNSIRSQQIDYLVSTTTKFPSTNNLNYVTFISYHSITTSSNANPTVFDFTVSSFGTDYIKAKLTVQNQVALKKFMGLVIVYDSVQMGVVGAIKLLAQRTVQITSPWDLSISYPDWGPSFNSKCIIGYKYFMYMVDEDFSMLFTYSAKSNFNGLQNTGFTNTNVLFRAVLFCVSPGHYQCGQDFPYLDSLNSQCYTAATCPIFTNDPGIVPTPPSMCQTCTQRECIDCFVLDRAYCLECDAATLTEAIDGDCLCITGYFNPRGGAVGCQLNCSYHLTGCKLNNCTSTTNCTQCQAGYFLSPALADFSCSLCNSSILNCVECLDINQCSLCQTKYYLNVLDAAHTNCLACSTAQQYCATCTPSNSGVTCNSCYPGYVHTATACICSTLNLTGCITCDIPTQCTSCRPAFYIQPATKLCQLCTTLFQCNTCTDYRTCVVCNQYYQTVYNSSDGSTSCKLCANLIPNCLECLSQSICTICDVGYGVNSTSKCQTCSTLHPHCVLCLNHTACQQCESNNHTFLVGTTCQICTDIDPNCQSCIQATETSILCIECDYGYTLDMTSQTCYKCSEQIDDCVECLYNAGSSKVECTLCSDLFQVDENYTCNVCKKGIYVTRTCSNVTGCTSSHMINGTLVCLTCDATLYFQYNTLTNKCDCQSGFVLNSDKMTCEQKCGDGIVNMMQCDDGNKINGDGCSDTCSIEENFLCSTNNAGLSECTLNQDVSVVFDYILRHDGENKASLYFTVTPASTLFSKVNWQKTISFNFSQTISTSFQYSDGILIITVEYSSDIDQKNMELNFTFNQSIIKSKPQSLNLTMDAINGPLTYQSDTSLNTFKIFSITGVVIGSICLVFYLVSSYFHKMIGLQTIQFIQLIYFVRLIDKSPASSSFYGFNSLKYANGFNEISFSDQNTLSNNKSIYSDFLRLNLKLYFLQNCNLMLIPIMLACLGYAVYSYKKYKARKLFTETKQKIYKDDFVVRRRQLDWIYDSFIFTFTLALLYIIIFSMLIYEMSNLKIKNSYSDSFVTFSYGVSLVILFFVGAIFCYQAINGVNMYLQLRDGKQNVRNDDKSLQHDANGQQNAYHPLYISFYLGYQLLIIVVLSMVILKLKFLIEIVFGLSVVYLIVICMWTPYSISVHNVAIILNQSTVVYFTMFQVLTKYKLLNAMIYNAVLFILMAFISIALILQIIRLYIHNKTVKSSYKIKKEGEQNSSNENEHKNKIKPFNPYSIQNGPLNNNMIDRSHLQFTFIKSPFLIPMQESGILYQVRMNNINNTMNKKDKSQINIPNKNMNVEQEMDQNMRNNLNNGQNEDEMTELQKVKLRLRKQYKYVYNNNNANNPVSHL